MPGSYDFDYSPLARPQPGMGPPDRARPRFFLQPVLDEAATQEKGHPVFVDTEFVEIRFPGNKNEIPVMKVADKHRNRWPAQYKAFKEGMEPPLEGFPIGEWAKITRSVAEIFNSVGIRTIEDLVAAADDDLKKIGPEFFNLKYQARDFLAENTTEKRQIAKLEEENQSLMERIAALEKKVSSDEDKVPCDDEEKSEPQTKARAAGRKKSTGGPKV